MAERSIASILNQILADIRALNTKIALVEQRINNILRNERILARNILKLNKKIKELESKLKPAEEGGVGIEELNKIREELFLLRSDLATMKDEFRIVKEELGKMREEMVTKEEFAELKYIIDTINPLEFVTYKELSELVEKKLREAGLLK